MIIGEKPPVALPDLSLQASEESSVPARYSFGSLLEGVDESLKQADTSAARYAAGQTDITNAVLSAQQATVHFDYLMAIRRQALAAYQQIMNLAY
jgi:flagellar hook-basal body complex protein FliE